MDTIRAWVTIGANIDPSAHECPGCYMLRHPNSPFEKSITQNAYFEMRKAKLQDANLQNLCQLNVDNLNNVKPLN